MQISELIAHLDEYLDVKAFRDPSLNGLQVEGFAECTKVATACSASLEAIDEAAERGADTLLVHHGLLWRGQETPIVGTFKNRINSLLEANINLIAYHLPLDAHYECGNNRMLCSLIGIDEPDYVVPGDKTSIAMFGNLTKSMNVHDIAAHLSACVDAPVQVLGDCGDDLIIRSAAVCSGSGSFLLDRDPAPQFDALITGDVNEQTYHLASESGTAVFVLGHHASEQGGIRRLGVHLAETFGLEHLHLHFSVEKYQKIYDSAH